MMRLKTTHAHPDGEANATRRAQHRIAARAKAAGIIGARHLRTASRQARTPQSAATRGAYPPAVQAPDSAYLESSANQPCESPRRSSPRIAPSKQRMIDGALRPALHVIGSAPKRPGAPTGIRTPMMRERLATGADGACTRRQFRVARCLPRLGAYPTRSHGQTMTPRPRRKMAPFPRPRCARIARRGPRQRSAPDDARPARRRAPPRRIEPHRAPRLNAPSATSTLGGMHARAAVLLRSGRHQKPSPEAEKTDGEGQPAQPENDTAPRPADQGLEPAPTARGPPRVWPRSAARFWTRHRRNAPGTAPRERGKHDTAPLSGH
ncbi:hypothetical protein SAMN05878426_101164 [Phaeovulum vinaykumarii]|uniref:Uncharacterized protein n=1 Tax=Phaeovulum vinaykumarii TaxID=407234 RepID=A0A1N7JMF3_9RHOB|nr:hypothetical protein SAMN05421795_101164 [Phaeovulum vinaykumarii]SOB90311.1 hypothetical protein SAMN05878426_101164 [Phaeovulum vinaykumarii]